MKIYFGAFICITFVCCMVNGEVFTAIDDMAGLVSAEEEILSYLKSYISVQEYRLITLKKFSSEQKKHHRKVLQDPSNYLQNPVNSFQIIKRLTVDWPQIEDIIMTNQSFEFIQNLTTLKEHLNLPSMEDLNGAAEALARLQDLYQLNATTVAKGLISGATNRSEMSAKNCFEMGHQLYLSHDHENAIHWFHEALRRIDQTNIDLRLRILKELTLSYISEEKHRAALQITNELIRLQSKSKQFRQTKNAMINEINENEENELDEILEEMETKKAIENDFEINDPLAYDVPQQNVYRKLCRNDLGPTPKQMAALRCRYVNNNSAFLKLAPLKMEEASLSPYIVVFHDVLYDAEIGVIKDLAQPRFERAAVDEFGVGAVYPKYRISKSAWLSDRKHKYIDDVSKRVEDMTGLTVKNNAEDLQVVNYGIGGHYEPHFDFALSDDFTYEQTGIGNRIATILFYMSDVTAGGATVFPLINVTLWPQKGSAAFWYNLYETGKGDIRTKHAACPVLIGSKWVCNKWLHANGQEFHRPCKLHPDHADDIVF